jgi:hypothetical protein
MWTRLFDTATPSSDNVIVAFNGTNIMLGTYVGSTGSTTLTSSAAMGTGWHQVSVTIDSQGTSTIYIDGNASAPTRRACRSTWRAPSSSASRAGRPTRTATTWSTTCASGTAR